MPSIIGIHPIHSDRNTPTLQREGTFQFTQLGLLFVLPHECELHLQLDPPLLSRSRTWGNEAFVLGLSFQTNSSLVRENKASPNPSAFAYIPEAEDLLVEGYLQYFGHQAWTGTRSSSCYVGHRK